MNRKIDGDDELLQDALRTAYADIPVPDAPPDAWPKLEARLKRRRLRRKWWGRAKIAAGIAAASLVINLSLGMLTPEGNAQFTLLFREIQKNVYHVLVPQTSPSSPQLPPDALANGEEEPAELETTLETARELLVFSPLVPTYVPGSFRLDIVRVYNSSEGYDNLFLEYMDDNGALFKITEKYYVGYPADVLAYVHKDAGEIKQTDVNGDPAVAVITPEGLSYLHWIAGGEIKISLSGHLPEDELMRVARSMKAE